MKSRRKQVNIATNPPHVREPIATLAKRIAGRLIFRRSFLTVPAGTKSTSSSSPSPLPRKKEPDRDTQFDMEMDTYLDRLHDLHGQVRSKNARPPAHSSPRTHHHRSPPVHTRKRPRPSKKSGLPREPTLNAYEKSILAELASANNEQRRELRKKLTPRLVHMLYGR